MRARQNYELFGSFNARALSAVQVAESFIPPPAFNVLVNADHSLLVGPRGSGKTTLLKMLQSEALEHWTHLDADAYRKRIDYAGVFIPTDNAWRAQSHYAQGIGPDHAPLVADSAFTTHVLKSLVETMRYRAHGPPAPTGVSHRRVLIGASAEAEMIMHLAQSWNLKPRLASLAGLQSALTSHLRRLGDLARRASVHGEDIPLRDNLFLYVEPLSAASEAIELFNGAAGAKADRWALLFDELELAPRGIRERLLSSFRSIDAHFLLKLSLAPFNESMPADSEHPPLPGQDYELISLAYARKVKGMEFARHLFEKEIAHRGLAHVSAESILGYSIFDSTDGAVNSDDTFEVDSAEAYASDSPILAAFRRLQDSDESFAAYLREAHINLDALEDLGPVKRAAYLRKARNLVVVRDAFRHPSGALRSRKSLELYTGAGAMFAISEGNPRLFIGLLRPLLNDLDATSGGTIPRSEQSRALRRTIDRFLALLRTIPAPIVEARSRDGAGNVVILLDAIGTYLSDEIIRKPFSSNVPGSFVVDRAIPPSLRACVGRAWNVGALVHIPRGVESVASGEVQVGDRFRLSYLLAPHYKLPLRLGRPVNLSSIFGAQSKYRMQGDGGLQQAFELDANGG